MFIGIPADPNMAQPIPVLLRYNKGELFLQLPTYISLECAARNLLAIGLDQIPVTVAVVGGARSIITNDDGFQQAGSKCTADETLVIEIFRPVLEEKDAEFTVRHAGRHKIVRTRSVNVLLAEARELLEKEDTSMSSSLSVTGEGLSRDGGIPGIRAHILDDSTLAAFLTDCRVHYWVPVIYLDMSEDGFEYGPALSAEPAATNQRTAPKIHPRLNPYSAKVENECVGLRSHIQADVRSAVGALHDLICVDGRSAANTVLVGDAVVDMEATTLLVLRISYTECIQTQTNAARCIAYLCAGLTDHVGACVAAGAVQECARQLERIAAAESPTLEELQLAEACTWALCNISGDTVEYRRLVLESSCVQSVGTLVVKLRNSFPIVRIPTTPEETARENILREIACLFYSVYRDPFSTLWVFDRDLFATLAVLMRGGNVDTIERSAWALASLCKNIDARRVLCDSWEDSIMCRVVYLLQCGQERVALPAARIVGLCALGKYEKIQIMVGFGVFDSLKVAFDTESLKAETTFALGNILSNGNMILGDLFVRAGFVERIVPLFRSNDPKESMEAVACIASLLKMKIETYARDVLNIAGAVSGLHLRLSDPREEVSEDARYSLDMLLPVLHRGGLDAFPMTCKEADDLKLFLSITPL